VIARHEDHAGAFVDLAQDLVNDLAMRLRPKPAALEGPAIDDVADQEQRVAGVLAQEVEQQVRLAAAPSSPPAAVQARKYGPFAALREVGESPPASGPSAYRPRTNLLQRSRESFVAVPIPFRDVVTSR
jgi:hypothetical protein